MATLPSKHKTLLREHEGVSIENSARSPAIKYQIIFCVWKINLAQLNKIRQKTDLTKNAQNGKFQRGSEKEISLLKVFLFSFLAFF